MNYYIIAARKELTHEPNLLLDYVKFRPFEINLKKSNQIPRIQFVDLKPDKKIVFYPILNTSFFCVNDSIMKIISNQELFLIKKQLICIDPQYSKVENYNILILDESDCCINKADRGYFNCMILDKVRIPKRNIFRVTGLFKSYVIVSQIIKDLLDDYAEFIELKEVQVVDKGI